MKRKPTVFWLHDCAANNPVFEVKPINRFISLVGFQRAAMGFGFQHQLK